MHEIKDTPAAVESARRRDANEIQAAINLILRGGARRVRLVNLADPLAVAGRGAADAAAAGLLFQVDEMDHNVEIIVGPRR